MANIPKPLQTNSPTIKPSAQGDEKGKSGLTRSISWGRGEMKQGGVNIARLNSLIRDDDRRFYYNAIAGS